MSESESSPDAGLGANSSETTKIPFTLEVEKDTARHSSLPNNVWGCKLRNRGTRDAAGVGLGPSVVKGSGGGRWIAGEISGKVLLPIRTSWAAHLDSTTKYLVNCFCDTSNQPYVTAAQG